MAFDIAGLLPGGQAFTRIAQDVGDIANVLAGLGGGQPAQAQAPARPADAFQAAAAPQQAAAGGPAQFGAAIQQIMQALTAITQLVGQLAGKGGAQQAQAPAVGVGQGGGAPAQVGGQAAPQAGAPQVQGGQGTIQPQPAPAPQGVNGNLALHGTGLILEGMGELLQALAGGKGAGQPSTPNPAEAGGLSASAGAAAVTTSGGYKIESTGQYNWQITAPDGKVTKVHGDPHYEGADGVKFDFKKDSAMVLPDGTRINVDCKDLGNGTSVTSALEITNNGQRAVIGGIDQGKGKVDTVDRNAEQFKTEQTFTLGADGSTGMNGKKITGQGGGVDQFKFGDAQQLTQAQANATAQAGAAAGAGGAAGAPQQGGLAGLLAQIQQLLGGLTGQQPAQGTAAPQGTPLPAVQQPAQGANEVGAQPPAQQARPQDVVSQLLQAIVGMLNALLPLLGTLGKGGGVQA